MNETLFENRFVRDRSAAKEIYGYWFYRRPLFVAIYVYFGIYILFWLFASANGLMSFSEGATPVIMILFASALFAFSYFSQVNTMVKRDKELSGGGQLVCEISVTDTEVIHVAAENRQSVAFSGIKKAVLTKGYILLITEAKFMYVMKKDSFTKGECDSFIAFLKEKGIKIKK